MTGRVLDQINDAVRASLVERVRRVPESELRALAQDAAPALDAAAALRRRPGGVQVIAEVKRASPSRGSLAEIPDPAELALAYERAGAAAVSVLTEETYFSGSLDDLVGVRAAVRLPVLRKDFILTPYQLWEARAYGADLALLIVASLSRAELRDLLAQARELGLTALVEVHDEAETERALAAGATMIGVNARDLKTLRVERNTFARLAPLIPPEVVRVAESGIRGPADVAAVAAHGADAVLVGESLVTAPDGPAPMLHALRSAVR
ncbi:indole-3-glycerol phosphate synthase TrpC [Streptomyces sp. NPDC059452]|uniref:indole-3-glycerol phosphate synthase TrpC n=1 Tax=Streptomyces sp. NPDC059452 TaxID=3346835 RepID=UPI0036C8A3FE